MIDFVIDWSGRAFGALFTISWQAAAIALFILAAQFLVRDRLPARWRYALWFLVIARLLLPTLPESPLSWQRVVPAAPVETTLRDWADQPVPFLLLRPPMPAPEVSAPKGAAPAPRAFSTLEIVGLVWLTGVVVLSIGFLFICLRFRLSLRAARPVTDPEMLARLQACGRDLGLRRTVRLWEMPGLTSPAVFGFFWPTLLIPKGFSAGFTPEEQRMIFLHETAHIKRWDIPVNTVLTVLQILHWFNPVLWIAFRRLRFDRECATDSLALSGPRATSRSLYGNTLLKLVERFSAPHHRTRMLGILENKRNLRARFLGIRHAHAGAYRWSLLGVVLILLLGAVTLTQPGAQAEATAPVESQVSKEDTRSFVQDVLKDVPRFGSSSLSDPQIKELMKVGPDNIDILIEENERINYPEVTNATVNYYISMAISNLARPQDRDLVVAALPKNRYLIYAIVRMKWAEAARPELLRVFREEPGGFAPGWIDAIASLQDPALYPELKEYLINGAARSYTYRAIKDLPGIDDLKSTVEQAWKIAEKGNDYDLRAFAEVAAGYGIADATSYREAHPEKPDAQVKEELSTAEKFAAAVQAAQGGSSLSRDQVENITKELQINPDDELLRMKVLGFYFTHRLQDASARGAALPHILWFIENQPGSPAAGLPYLSIQRISDAKGYEAARTAWRIQTEKFPTDANVLGNAGIFESINDPREALRLLREAQKLDPTNLRWSIQLTALLTQQVASGPNPQYPDAAAEAYAINKETLKLKTGVEYFYVLTETAPSALRAAEITAAAAYARELLEIAQSYKQDWNYGNAIYKANSVLGVIALRDGNLSAAEKYLLSAGSTPGSPQLDSFGPDFTLAQQILEEGQRDTVITFLDKVAKFWKGREAQLKRWQDAIRRGEKPRLDRNALVPPTPGGAALGIDLQTPGPIFSTRALNAKHYSFS